MANEKQLTPEEIGQAVTMLIRNLRVDEPAERSRSRDEIANDRRLRDEEALRADSEARRQRIVESVLKGVVPPKLYGLITGRPFHTPAAKIALDWWEDGPRLCVLRGPMSVGKSAAAALVCKHAAEHGKRSISWHRPDEFVSAVLHDYDPDAPKLGRDLVVIDDMGRETKPSYAEALTSFLDNKVTRVLITTNDLLLTWVQRYDPRLLARMADEGDAYDIVGEPLRQKGMGF